MKTAQLGKMEAEVQQMIQGRQETETDREIANVLVVLTAQKRSVEKGQKDLNNLRETEIHRGRS